MAARVRDACTVCDTEVVLDGCGELLPVPAEGCRQLLLSNVAWNLLQSPMCFSIIIIHLIPEEPRASRVARARPPAARIGGSRAVGELNSAVKMHVSAPVRCCLFIVSTEMEAEYSCCMISGCKIHFVCLECGMSDSQR